MEKMGNILQTSINALPIEVGIIDANGDFVFKNGTWKDFSPLSRGVLRTTEENYLHACKHAGQSGDDIAQDVYNGITDILNDERDGIAYPYISEDPLIGEEQRYVLRAIGFTSNNRKYVIIFHLDEGEKTLNVLHSSSHKTHLSSIAEFLGGPVREKIDQLKIQTERISNQATRKSIADTTVQSEELIDGAQRLATGGIDNLKPISLNNLFNNIERYDIQTITINAPEKQKIIGNKIALEWAFEKLMKCISDSGKDTVTITTDNDTLIITESSEASIETSPVSDGGYNPRRLSGYEAIQAARCVFDAHQWCFSIDEDKHTGVSFIIRCVDLERVS